MAADVDPAVSVCFSVNIDNDDLGYFISCEGLGVEVVLEQREEGGIQQPGLAAADPPEVHEHQAQPPARPGHSQDHQVVREHDDRRQAQHRDDRREERQERGRRDLEPARASSPSGGPGRASTSSRRRSPPRRSRSPTTASCRPEGGVRWPPRRSPCTGRGLRAGRRRRARRSSRTRCAGALRGDAGRSAVASWALRSAGSSSSSTPRNCRSRSRRSGSARTRAAPRRRGRRSSAAPTRAS